MAARWGNYKIDEFFDRLDPRWQAFTIAAYRGNQRLESVLAFKQAQKMKEKQRRANKPIK